MQSAKLIFFNPIFIMTKTKTYSLKKSFKILHQTYKDYKRKRSKLSQLQRTQIETLLKNLEAAFFKKDKAEASNNAHNLEKSAAIFLKKSPFEKVFHFVLSLSVALLIAIVIRQMWFENYTIPTGSMRPTLKEKDFLVVSKTNFALNKPSVSGHFHFNKSLISHGDIIVFTTADMDVADSDYLYFFVLPGKKQYVKRLLGKPGDTLYFYGGEIYGFDKAGKRIEAFQTAPYLANIEHIPFIRPEGKLIPVDDQHIIYQMNQPLVRIGANKASLFSDLKAKDYYQLWGFENFAMSQIVQKNHQLFLEFTHHPSIKRVTFEKDFAGSPKPALSQEVSEIPLDKKHLKAIFENLTTCRFTIKDGYGIRIGSTSSRFSPYLGEIPNGTYEFQDGTAYKVNLLGVASKLSPSNPLSVYSKDLTIALYNLGIEMNTLFLKENHTTLSPSRYAYFKNGDLILMNHPIFFKNDPALKNFVAQEQQKPNGFFDRGAPLKSDGSLDIAKIEKYGLKIPEDSYLALGDNHAMSADSRDFGFVPEKNLRGNPSFLFWPPGKRFGTIDQPKHSLKVFPKMVVWSAFGLFLIGYYIYRKKKSKKHLKF